MRVLGVVMVGAAMLGGCGGDKANDPVSVAKAALPVAVQTMVDAPFAEDGEIHVQARGAFVVKAEAAICAVRAEIDPSLKKGAPGFYDPGLDGHEGGSLNEPLRNGTICADNGQNLVSHWKLLKNRNGTPYKLVLAVWQGDVAKGGAVWVGAVERLDGKNPTVKVGHVGMPPYDEEGLAGHALGLSVSRDIQALSESFTSRLSNADRILK
jgi:hypothetical protein